jgi:hypothetical protein
MLNNENQAKPSTLKEAALSKPSISNFVNKTPNTIKKKTPLKFIFGGLILLLLVVGSASALYLTQINQDVRQQASEGQPYCGDGICQNPGSPCQCTADCGVPAGGCSDNTPEPTSDVLSSFGQCDGVKCTSDSNSCISVHHCDEIASNGECTVLHPDVKPKGSSVNAQAEANSSCKCVQVDVVKDQGTSCSTGHIEGDHSRLIGAVVVCPNNGCSTPTPTNPPTNPPTTPPTNPPTNPPTTPPTNPPTTPPTNQPSPSPTLALCNEACSVDSDCYESNHSCTGGVCRLTANPTSPECQPAIGPMCLDVDLVDSQTGVPLTQDPSFGDSVKFTCAEVAGVDHYIFRVIEPDSNIVDVQATGRTSSAYTISKSGKFYAQCQICTTSSDDSCNSYEALN